MVGHRDEIVFVQLWGRLVLRLDKLREVQVPVGGGKVNTSVCPLPTPCLTPSQPPVHRPDRKLHKGVQLFTGESGVGKALQVDNECLWQLPQVQLLGGQLVLLAGGTEPADRARVTRHFLGMLCTRWPLWVLTCPDAALISSPLVPLVCFLHVKIPPFLQVFTDCLLDMLLY